MSTEKVVEGLYFRVYPEHRRLHFDVFLWPTVKSMRQYLTAQLPRRGMSKVLACVVWPINAKDRPRRDYLGEMHFNQTHLGRDIIAHEATHAALAWARRLGVRINEEVRGYDAPADEERFCDVIGALTHQILETLDHYGISTGSTRRG